MKKYIIRNQYITWNNNKSIKEVCTCPVFPTTHKFHGTNVPPTFQAHPWLTATNSQTSSKLDAHHKIGVCLFRHWVKVIIKKPLPIARFNIGSLLLHWKTQNIYNIMHDKSKTIVHSPVYITVKHEDSIQRDSSVW